MASSAPPREPVRPRRKTRPGTRALVDDHRPTWDDAHEAIFVAGNEAPLIGDAPQRAGAAQRKVAMSTPE